MKQINRTSLYLARPFPVTGTVKLDGWDHIRRTIRDLAYVHRKNSFESWLTG